MKRNTVQRELVRRAVRELPEHVDAETVYRHIAGSYSAISRSTVYRNLQELCQAGQLRRLPLPDGANRVDYVLSPHCHFICRVCGGIFNVEAPHPASWQATVDAPAGFQFEERLILYSGVCAACQTSSDRCPLPTPKKK